MNAVKRREQIASAAMRCFAERGFEGTTTRMLARAAGVSEGLIFRHFPTKKSLYRAIIARRIAEGASGLMPAEAAERGDDRAVLSSIASTLVARVGKDPSFMRLLFYSALEGAPLSRMFYQARVRRVRSFLASYLERRMKEGALRVVDPVAAAGAFMGMVANYVQQKHLFRVPVSPLPVDRLVETWVDLFLGGLRR
ncbi:MAG TPA: TetR/AcrR family transcriptional regulator [Candidatus Eisenbacteria bacterium]|nr:TetR/AcrR family transcriptional regulator [Candidatus Eisenbacteria bacterium]